MKKNIIYFIYIYITDTLAPPSAAAGYPTRLQLTEDRQRSVFADIQKQKQTLHLIAVSVCEWEVVKFYFCHFHFKALQTCTDS